MTTTTTKRGAQRARGAAAASKTTTPATRVRKRDRIRAAATGMTFGVPTLALIGTAAVAALGYLGVRKADADRRKADPTAKPLVREILDKAGDTATTVKDKAVTIATDVSDRASATVHDLGRSASTARKDLAAKIGVGTDAAAERSEDAA